MSCYAKTSPSCALLIGATHLQAEALHVAFSPYGCLQTVKVVKEKGGACVFGYFSGGCDSAAVQNCTCG